jgi:hypothetical protein
MSLDDKRIDFLRLPNVKLIPWKMESALNHREEMLSAFVFGPPKDVQTSYWLKLDADAYAVNSKPLVYDEMKKYLVCGHKWGYSWVEHIKMLDAWAKNHNSPILNKATPMMQEGHVEGRKFWHDRKRTNSFIQLHKTEFSKFCISLLSEKKLPCPSHDTFYYYVISKFNPLGLATPNMKKNCGIVNINGRRGVGDLDIKLKEIDRLNER